MQLSADKQEASLFSYQHMQERGIIHKNMLRQIVPQMLEFWKKSPQDKLKLKLWYRRNSLKIEDEEYKLKKSRERSDEDEEYRLKLKSY